MARDRIRPHILLSEARCRCGCGSLPHGRWLDTVDRLIDLIGFPIGISTMARCKTYNDKIGGVKYSPHLLFGLDPEAETGGADLRCRDPRKRMVIVKAALDLEAVGLITQIEVCDGHIHVASVPPGHRLHGLMNTGISK